MDKIETEEIQNHLGLLFKAIQGNNSMNEKVNALIYFESLIINSHISNRMINSVFMQLLEKLMKSVKTPVIKIRLCSVIGLLIRHSTVIENELAESDICA